jgi:hypothetical protein
VDITDVPWYVFYVLYELIYLTFISLFLIYAHAHHLLCDVSFSLYIYMYVYRYCDDTCALAGWLTHSRACLHRPRFDGHGGFAAKTDDPWVLKGSKYKQGITGEIRRYLLRAQVTVEHPSGRKEVIREVDRFIQGRKGEPIPPLASAAGSGTSGKKKTSTSNIHEVYSWMVPSLICRLRRITPKGEEKFVEVKLLKVILKPTTKQLLEELGRLVIEDEDLYAKVKDKTYTAIYMFDTI